MERDAAARKKSPQGLVATPSLAARLLTPLCLLTTNRALNATEPAREKCSILLCNHHHGHLLWSKSPVHLRGRHSCCSHFTEEKTEAQRGQESPYLNAGQSDAKDCSVQDEGKLEAGENESGF